MYLGRIWRFNALPDKRFRISKSLYTPFLSMLFLLFLYYLLQGVYIDAGPIPTAKNRSLAENHFIDLTHRLTIWEIAHPSVQIHVRYEDNMMTMCCLGRPSGHPADGTMYTMLTGQPDNIK